MGKYVCDRCGYDSDSDESFTWAQTKINDLVFRGWSNRRIASQLDVSMQSVSNWRQGKSEPRGWTKEKLGML